MFYIKAKLNENVEIRVELNDDNVFTICPMCGREHSICLPEFMDGCIDFDLVSEVYCEECSEKLNSYREEESA